MKRPSPALVVSCLALGLALGGTGYATGLNVPKNSVGTTQLKTGAVTTKKVKNGTLLKADFKPGQLPAGPQGPQGPAGVPGVSGLERVDVTTSSSSTNSKSLLVNCPSPKRAVSGGARVLGPGSNRVSITASFPDSSGTQWDAAAVEVSGTAQVWQLQAYALCANVSG